MPLRSATLREDQALQACLVRDQAHVLPGARGPRVAKIQRALLLLDQSRIRLSPGDPAPYCGRPGIPAHRPPSTTRVPPHLRCIPFVRTDPGDAGRMVRRQPGYRSEKADKGCNARPSRSSRQTPHGL